jgi:hypothetical protein
LTRATRWVDLLLLPSAELLKQIKVFQVVKHALGTYALPRRADRGKVWRGARL